MPRQLSPMYGLLKIVPDNDQRAFQQRLKEVVQRLGVAPLASKIGMSQAQLYRYLNGTPLPHHRLAKICELSGVSSDWLIFGEQPKLLEIDDVLTTVGHVTQTTLATLQLTNETPAWRPSELQTLIPLLVLNELNNRRHQPVWRLSETEVLRALDVLRQMRLKMLLEPYVQHLIQRYSRPNDHLPASIAGPFCGYVDMANQAYFESQAGENYYQRVAHHLKPVSLQWVQSLISVLEQRGMKQRLRLLDAGAGTGRYLRYLHRNYADWFELHGIERSSKAFKYIQEFESRDELPKGCIIQDDYCRNTSLSKGSFDVVISYMNLHYFAYVPDAIEHGLGQALNKLASYLKSKGILHIVIRHGLNQIFLPHYSRAHKIEEIIGLAKQVGLNIVKSKPVRYETPTLSGHEVPLGFEEIMEISFYKS